ncbi:MAG: MBL fold metallo-hydrolase [Bacilli bacterium]
MGKQFRNEIDKKDRALLDSFRDVLEFFDMRKHAHCIGATLFPLRDAAILRRDHDMQMTWLGHSSWLISYHGVHILLDPIWNRNLPFVKAIAAPPYSFNDLPPIDVVCISHSHYDHLDEMTIRMLPKETKFLVPAGLEQWFVKRGYENTTECNWWERFVDFGIIFNFVPAKHWSRRSMFDKNNSHWGGWVIEFPEKTVYFAGDTAYCPSLKKIGEVFSIDYALLPIGAYNPEELLKEHHCTPEEAVQIFRELGAKKFFPMHYGTFRLASDSTEEALHRLENAFIEQNVAEEYLQLLMLGETYTSQVVSKVLTYN